MPSGAQFSFFGSFELGTDPFPLSAIPLQQIVAKVETADYAARPSRVFRFEEIAEAHRVMERGETLGKLVVAGV
jgi:NADPH:quinone reductase-like Zn-dependent oxidoreductase